MMAVHGLNDNAASFDALTPHLEAYLDVVCIDLPGHGLSSHFPPGVNFSVLDYIQALKFVADHFNWFQFSILAHSFGSHVSVYFAALFANCVQRVLLIDPFFVHIVPEKRFIMDRFQIVLDKHLNFQEKETKYYSYEECLEKLCEGRQSRFTIKSARVLQTRSFTKTNRGFVLNNDRRLKLLTYPLITPDLHFALVKAVSCPLMIISTSEFEPFLMTPTTHDSLKVLRLGSRMQMVRVEGSHDVHMDYPHLVAPLVKRFFTFEMSHL